MDQINMIGELMTLMQHEDINSISPIIMHTQSESQVGKFSNWITGLKTTGIVILGIAIVVGIIFCWLKCCPNVTCNCKEGNGGGNNNRRFEQSYPMNFFPSAPAAETSPPLYPALNSPTVSPSPQTARHSHVHITLEKTEDMYTKMAAVLLSTNHRFDRFRRKRKRLIFKRSDHK